MSVEIIKHVADGYNFYTEVLTNAGVQYIPAEINKDAPLCVVTGGDAIARVRLRLLQETLLMSDWKKYDLRSTKENEV